MNRKQPTARLGQATCQCSACGETFASTGAFDKHRLGRHGVDRKCADLTGAEWRKRTLGKG